MNRRASTKRSAKAAIYRNAAKMLEDRALHSGEPGDSEEVLVKFSCCAVAEAEGIYPEWNVGDKYSTLATRYRDIFSGDFEPYWTDDGRDERVLALCFMAAMVEAGDA